MVVFARIVYFVKISICGGALSQLMWQCMPSGTKIQFNKLEQLKLLPNSKSATADEFTTKNTRRSVEC